MNAERDGASLGVYLDAIRATGQCAQTQDGDYRCVISAPPGWQANGATEGAAELAAGEQALTWVAQHLIRQAPLPPFQSIQPQVEETRAPEALTARLRLIPYSLALVAAAALDHAALAAMLGARVHPEWGFAGTDPADISPDTVSWRMLMFSMAVQRNDIAPWKWLIVHVSDNVVIGDIGTFNPPGLEEDEDSIQFSYRLVAAYHDHGYMTEAARHYVAWAFAQPRVSWIYAMTESDNIASQRVLEKLGARRFYPDDSIPEWVDWELLPNSVESTGW